MGKKITGRIDQTRGVTGVTREASAPSGGLTWKVWQEEEAEETAADGRM